MEYTINVSFNLPWTLDLAVIVAMLAGLVYFSKDFPNPLDTREDDDY